VGLEVGGQREERLGRREGVALGLVRAVRGQPERGGDVGERARAGVGLATLDTEQAPQQRGVDRGGRQPALERPEVRA